MRTRYEERVSVSRRIWTVLAVLTVIVLVFGFAAPVALAADHGVQPTPEPFTFDYFKIDLAVWNLIIFVIVCLILCKFAFVPIAKALDQREQSVADNIAAAERSNADAKALLETYQKKLADADDEVRAIIEEGKKDAERISQSIVEKAREAAKSEHERAMKDIEAATTNALRDIASQSASLATDLAGKIIRTQIDPNAHKSLIETALQQFNTKS